MSEFKSHELPKLEGKPSSQFKIGDFTNHGTITFIDATHDFLHRKTKERWENEDGTNTNLSIKTDKGWFHLSDLVSAEMEMAVVDKDAIKPAIEFNELHKMDIRICQIISAEKVKGADKLLVLQIHTGKDERQVVTNIGEFFSPESLVGKKFPFILNLKPAKIRKIDSFGMIVCVNIQGSMPEMIESNSPVGSKIF
jgi:methionine--tRNA ligase beta chain